MHTDLLHVCTALEQFADTAIASLPHGTDQIFNEIWGWPAPAINRQDFAWVARSIADDLRAVNADQYPESLVPWVTHLPHRIALLQGNNLPNVYQGNIQAISVILDTFKIIRDRLLPAVGWLPVPTTAVMPVQLLRRTTAAQRRIDEVEKTIPELSGKVAAINEAHLVAGNLEVDLLALTEAREAVERTARQTDQNAAEAKDAAAQSAAALESIQNRVSTAWDEVHVKTETALDDMQKKVQASLDTMKQKEEIAEKLIAQCEAAYHITTTKGLAGAFDQRAASLGKSMQYWVGGLAAALVAGSVIGATRLSNLAAELTSTTPNWPTIATQIVLSILGVGAPLWFSWLATKQIGQRFRLSEDYAFKASVAKAYEGYRKEAAVLDPEFQAKLFRSALTRLDEAPLRLVEVEQHASPWQEALQSTAVKNAMKMAPELQTKFMGMVNDTLQQGKNIAAEAVKVVSATRESASPRDSTTND